MATIEKQTGKLTRNGTMIIMTTMLVISALLGSAIAIDDLKAALNSN